MTVTPANEPAPKQSWWWPSVETATTARKVIRKAFWVTVIVAVVTAAFAAVWLDSGVGAFALRKHLATATLQPGLAKAGN